MFNRQVFIGAIAAVCLLNPASAEIIKVKDKDFSAACSRDKNCNALGTIQNSMAGPYNGYIISHNDGSTTSVRCPTQGRGNCVAQHRPNRTTKIKNPKKRSAGGILDANRDGILGGVKSANGGGTNGGGTNGGGSSGGGNNAGGSVTIGGAGHAIGGGNGCSGGVC